MPEPRRSGLIVGGRLISDAATTRDAWITLENEAATLRVAEDSGDWEIEDKQSGVIWRSNPFGTGIAWHSEPSGARRPLGRPTVTRQGDRLVIDTAEATMTFRLSGAVLDLDFRRAESASGSAFCPLAEALWSTDAEESMVLLPVREGMAVRSHSGKQFVQRFRTYGNANSGLTMQMAGYLKRGAALLVTWDDPALELELSSKYAGGDIGKATQTLSSSFWPGAANGHLRLHLLGRGDIGSIGRAYREIAREKGYLVRWDEKLQRFPNGRHLFGAVGVKLWQTFTRRLERGADEPWTALNFTFDEVAQVAEHLKHDLKLDRVHFTIGGWSNRGYDNQHPDILPANPECGGDEALATCSRRVQELGYLFGLHDNYMDIYRDSPSWDEGYLIRDSAGRVVEGRWYAGGQSYRICSSRALELAQRPQNLPAIKRLFDPNTYFIDELYSTGLYDCHAPEHPQDRLGDILRRSAMSEYARDLFGQFGSEDGQEWAVPHADFFEGIVGVAGQPTRLPELSEIGATTVPLFEMVYRDCIAAYGKYAYPFAYSAPFVLHHISLGRPLYYSGIDGGIYWQGEGQRQSSRYPIPDAETAVDFACFARSHGGWAEGMVLIDRFIKNTYEITSPLHELTATMPLTACHFLTADGKVRRTIFGDDHTTVVVNGSDHDYLVRTRAFGEALLPPLGFVIEGPDFVAFRALTWNGLRYDNPVLFTLRSLDGQPIPGSRQCRVFHGHGEDRLATGRTVVRIPREDVIAYA